MPLSYGPDALAHYLKLFAKHTGSRPDSEVYSEIDGLTEDFKDSFAALEARVARLEENVVSPSEPDLIARITKILRDYRDRRSEFSSLGLDMILETLASIVLDGEK